MSLPSDPSRGNGGNGDSVHAVDGSTGRSLLVLADGVHGDERAMASAVRTLPGVSSVATASDYTQGALNVAEADAADAQLFPRLGVAVVTGEAAEALPGLVEHDDRYVTVEAEQRVRALSVPMGRLPLDYLRGFRDASNELYDQLGGRRTNGGPSTAVLEAPQFADTATLTWGLQATGVASSRATGQGVRVAVLDTGYDAAHPDLAGRTVVASSFVPNETAQDGGGHGTHTLGTVGGPARPPGGGRRYGCASAASLYVGKVLNNLGTGSDGQILAGIEWALTNQCRVVSMSLAAAVATSSVAYDTVGRRALAAQCLLVAAAGNNAKRAQGDTGFVERPANSPYVMAVAALDAGLRIGNFSARTGGAFGGGVDIAAPGVAVSSSWPVTSPPGGGPYESISGTSMAAPHVAGIAALWSQATGATGLALWGQLTLAAQRLPLPSVDVGAGLVRAPQD
jgi:subtilisin